MAAQVVVKATVFGHFHKYGLSYRLWTCRLASGDNEGRVVVWDVTTATAMATLEDPSAAAAAAGPSPKKVEPGKGGPVRDLVWVMSNPCLLAVVLANGMLLVWDQAGEDPMAGQGSMIAAWLPQRYRSGREVVTQARLPQATSVALQQLKSQVAQLSTQIDTNLQKDLHSQPESALPADHVPGDGMLLVWNQAGAQLPLRLNPVLTGTLKPGCTSAVAVLRVAASLVAADAPKALELCSTGIEGHCCLCTAPCEDCYGAAPDTHAQYCCMPGGGLEEGVMA